MSNWEDQPHNRPVFRDGKVHVNDRQCATCVFRPGNLMHLQEGALWVIIHENLERNTVLICHENMDTDYPGTCHGFYHAGFSQILDLAGRMGCLEFQPVAGDNSTTTPGDEFMSEAEIFPGDLPQPPFTIAVEEIRKLDASSYGRLITYLQQIERCANKGAQLTTFSNKRITLHDMLQSLEMAGLAAAHAQDILRILPEREEVKSASEARHD